MIIECIVTTRGADGAVNVAPMGVEWGEEILVVKPFLDTTTFRNLRDTGAAVVNITDDALLFARAAISNPVCAVEPAAVVRGVVLKSACSWREVDVHATDATPPRARMEARVVHRGFHREFIGFNRARHAVLEAAILATRIHLLAADYLRGELQRLQVIVDKTAGPAELEAMALLRDHIERALAPTEAVVV